jgi:hypothetical protein
MMCLILWLAAPYMSLADLLALALTGKEGKNVAARELFSNRRAAATVPLGVRLVFDDIFAHRENRFTEFPPFVSITGQEIRLMNWYVVLDILRRYIAATQRPVLKKRKGLAEALICARSGNYRLLKKYIGKNEETARELMHSAIHNLLVSPREPWWLGPQQRKMVFAMLCKPFCCFCAKEMVSTENARLLLIDETPNVHLACMDCHSQFCAHVPFCMHGGSRRKLLL